MSDQTENYGLPLVPPNAADPSIPVNDSLTAVDSILKEFEQNSSIPTGGNEGDFLAKGPDGYVFVSPEDMPKELPAGGTAGQVLAKTADGYAWINPPSGGGGSAEYPSGGSVGQVLKIQSVNPLVVAWANDIVGTGSGGGSGPGGGTAHRAWRVRITKSATGNSGIDDVQFRSQAGVTEQPTGGAIIASGETIRAKEQAFDNDTHSSSYPGWATAGLNGWVGYDFVTPKEVVEVRLRNNFDENAQELAIDFTDDPPNDPGAVWTTAVDPRPVSFANFGAELLIPVVSTAVPYIVDPGDGTSGDVLTLHIDGQGNRTFSFDPAGVSGGTNPNAEFIPPLIADYPTVSGSWPTLELTQDPDVGLQLFAIPVTGDLVKSISRNLPASGDWTYTLRIRHCNVALNYHSLGICLVNDDFQWVFGYDVSRSQLVLVQYAQAGGFQGNPLPSQPIPVTLEWIRVRWVEATDKLFFEWSPDGKQWITSGDYTTLNGYHFPRIGIGQGINRGQIHSGDRAGFTVPYAVLTT